MASGKKDHSTSKISRERIEILFHEAYLHRDDPTLSKRYVFLARELAMRQRLTLPKKYRRMFCKTCGAYFIPGENLRVRVSRGKVVYTCEVCGAVKRFPIK